ncbi:MAG: TonB-dependent receptor, partial [Prevotella sp.]|nr:TonB-dependent receptor [Prevotella sp.]
HKDWQFSLTWTNPFCNKYKASEGELLNRNLHKFTTVYNSDSGNRVALNVSWRLSRGKAHKAAAKTINLQDTDNGIIK